MKILVLSDSHGNVASMASAFRAEKPDTVLHLGDYVRDFEKLQAMFPDSPMFEVRGNCDSWSDSPDFRTVARGGKRIFMTHGHRYQVKYMYMKVIYAALEQEADVLLFGHTHVPELFQEGNLWVMNPGPAGDGHYGIIEIADGDISCRLAQISERKSDYASDH